MDGEGLAGEAYHCIKPQKNWALAIHGQAEADENGLPLMMNVPILGGFGTQCGQQHWHTIRWACPSAPGIPHQGCIYMSRQNPPSWEQEPKFWWISGWRGCVSIQDKEACYDKAPESGDSLTDGDLLQCLKVLW